MRYIFNKNVKIDFDFNLVVDISDQWPLTSRLLATWNFEAFYYYLYNTKLIGSPQFITEKKNFVKIRNTVLWININFIDKKKNKY